MRVRFMEAVAGLLMLAATGASAKGPGQGKEHGPEADIASYFSYDDYPVSALRASEQGRVGADLTIDASGKVTNCVVSVSSGSNALDGGTCAIALTRIVFTPATDRYGRSIPSHRTISIRWQIPETVNASEGVPQVEQYAVEDQELAVEIGFDIHGLLTSCKVLASAPSPNDACKRFPIGQEGFFWLPRQHPHAGKVVFHSSMTFSLDPDHKSP